MKSNLITKLILANFLAVNLACGDGLFVGAKASYNFKQDTKGTLEIPLSAMSIVNNSNSSTNTEDKYSLGVKFGYDFDLWRAYTAFVYNPGGEETISDTVDFISAKAYSSDLLIGADWTPNLSKDFKAVAGIVIGVSRHTTEASLSSSSLIYKAEINQTGFVYGLKLGGIYELNNHNEIEFGFKANRAEYSNKNSVNFNIVNLKRTTAGVFIGYNYKF